MDVESKMMNSAYAKINVLEARLLSVNSQRKDGIKLDGLFPNKAVVLYYNLLGDAYMNLKQATSMSSNEDVVERCLQAYESGVSCAAKELDIWDPLRLLCIYSWCKAMIVLKNKHLKARALADQTFNLASLHTHEISPESVDLLQRLRDDIMSYVSNEDNDRENKGISKSEANSIENVLKSKPKSHPIISKYVEDGEGGEYTGIAVSEVPAARRDIVMCTQSVRRIVSLPVPVQLDVVPSASLILKALDRIFRTYVRGTALPGQLAGGNTVELDGTTVSFRNFILHGPYISWKGFVMFLLDFAIAAPPAVSTRSGRSFLADVLNGDASRLPGGGVDPGDVVRAAGTAEGEAVVAPVTMIEAAVVFIEASKSITPALVLSKFLKMYEEMAQNIEGDPWASVSAWAGEANRGEWEIRSGVNFMQFVDCLGKLGMVAYKGARYSEMLPTASDKMEHFLSAHMGLTDVRKWQRKVESKLKKIKSTIKEVADGSPHKFRHPAHSSVRKV